jgi:hypothetical protein
LLYAEPQVTVTAKGTTLDMDQLLYTFVNGQLVPASSLSPSAFQNGSIQLFMSSNGQTKMVVGQQGQQQRVEGFPQERSSRDIEVRQRHQAHHHELQLHHGPVESRSSSGRAATAAGYHVDEGRAG